MELSKRLMAVAGLVKQGDRPADIGCDHGYVSIYLVKEKVLKISTLYSLYYIIYNVINPCFFIID